MINFNIGWQTVFGKQGELQTNLTDTWKLPERTPVLMC